MRRRKVYVKLSGSRIKVVIKKANRNHSKCGCGRILEGIPRLSNRKFKNLAKSEKKVNRPYGGVLCSSCMREEIIRRTRS